MFHTCVEKNITILEQHKAGLPQVEKDWAQQHAGRPHVRLSFRTTWEKPNDADGLSGGMTAEELKDKFEAKAQEVFSRVQHHWHNLADDGKTRVPQPYCRDKGKRARKKGAKTKNGRHEVCKHEFPQRLHVLEPAVICAYLAKRYGKKVKGRRNALSLIHARRNCEWLNGTCPLLAVFFRSNTDLKPSFRTPLTRETHEACCPGPCLEDEKGDDARSLRLCIIAQRAMKK